MNGTHHDLQAMAHYIACYGLHTGIQMAVCGADGITRFDIAALAYQVTDAAAIPDSFVTVPECFFSDEATALELIQSSDRAMACLEAISAELDPDPTDPTPPCTTNGRPDPIEHVSNWAATASPVDPKRPPTVDEVIGCILRAANHAQTTAA